MVHQPTPAEAQPHPAERGIRSTIVGIMINFALAVVKTTAGYAGNSYALVADGIESASDVISSLIVYFGLRIAMLPPDENHPYGHGKAEPIAASVVSLALVGAGITIIVQSVREIITPHHAPAPFTLIVLALVVIVKEGLFRYVFRVGESASSTAVKTDAWHHRSDAITSALAFAGISIALIGGAGYESADDWAALAAAAIILINAGRLFKNAMEELTDTLPANGMAEGIRAVAAGVPGVSAIDKLWYRKMGFDYYVDIHVEVDGNLPVREGHRIAHLVKDSIRDRYPRVAEVMVHIEPAGGVTGFYS